MRQIPAKIYYLISSGEVLFITSEMEGCIEGTTKEEDMQIYPQLKDKNIAEVDYIELEYGTLAATFTNSKSYSINLETNQLEIIYYTQEELNTMLQATQEIQDLNTRTTDIATYLSSSDEATIAEIENYILEIELNKTINGGM